MEAFSFFLRFFRSSSCCCFGRFHCVGGSDFRSWNRRPQTDATATPDREKGTKWKRQKNKKEEKRLFLSSSRMATIRWQALGFFLLLKFFTRFRRRWFGCCCCCVCGNEGFFFWLFRRGTTARRVFDTIPWPVISIGYRIFHRRAYRVLPGFFFWMWLRFSLGGTRVSLGTGFYRVFFFGGGGAVRWVRISLDPLQPVFPLVRQLLPVFFFRLSIVLRIVTVASISRQPLPVFGAAIDGVVVGCACLLNWPSRVTFTGFCCCCWVSCWNFGPARFLCCCWAPPAAIRSVRGPLSSLPSAEFFWLLLFIFFLVRVGCFAVWPTTGSRWLVGWWLVRASNPLAGRCVGGRRSIDRTTPMELPWPFDDSNRAPPRRDWLLCFVLFFFSGSSWIGALPGWTGFLRHFYFHCTWFFYSGSPSFLGFD